MVRKGTGFTNINRILQANRGSGLGGAVAGGITGQVQKVQSGVKSAQDQFQDEANKNRLDTPEAAEKRQSVLGRFDESNYQPDMSKFTVSSGVQQGFDANKQRIEQEKAAKAAEVEAAKAKQTQFQSQLTPLQQQFANTKQFIPGQTGQVDPFLGFAVDKYSINPEYTKLQNQIKSLEDQSKSLAPTIGTDLSAYDKQLTDVQSAFEKQKQSEMDAYQKAERQRLLTANLPTEQEIKDFTKYRTGTYTGPAELSDAQTLIGRAQQAESLGGLARSSGGRQELLRQFVGGRDYTQGQRTLDETILGQDQSANLGAAARQTRGVVGDVQQANRLAGSQAEEYRNRAKIFGEETRGMIEGTKNPLSSSLDERIAAAQKAEETRLGQFKTIQDVLTGKAAGYEKLDKMTQLGLALQQAQNLGALDNSQVSKLLGEDGVLQRGLDLGLDLNTLVNERLQNTTAQNLNRAGIASDEDVARLNALDRLMGKQGTDLEFLDSRNKFQAGKLGFDIGSLEEYINRAEQQKALNDKATADKIAARQARYMNQAAGGLQSAAGGAMQASGAALNQALNPESWVNPGQMGQNLNQYAQGAAGAATGVMSAGQQATAGILEGLTKLNVGGQSLANTEGGRQLLKAISLYSDMSNKGVGAINDYVSGLGGATQDLLSGNIGGALTQYLSTPANVIKNLTKGIKIKIKKPKIRISDEDLKEDIDYNPEDVQKFMDRIKPAAYNYKDEVKDDPRASKNRELGVMAQDLEKSKLGKEAVHDTPKGKIVDYDNLEPKMLASLASLNERLKRIEGKK